VHETHTDRFTVILEKWIIVENIVWKINYINNPMPIYFTKITLYYKYATKYKEK
jgi:hypothetical protein